MTTTRIGESASWDIVGFKQCAQVSAKYENLVQTGAARIAQNGRGLEERKLGG